MQVFVVGIWNDTKCPDQQISSTSNPVSGEKREVKEEKKKTSL